MKKWNERSKAQRLFFAIAGAILGLLVLLYGYLFFTA